VDQLIRQLQRHEGHLNVMFGHFSDGAIHVENVEEVGHWADAKFRYVELTKAP
jgi:hypothetical protein